MAPTWREEPGYIWWLGNRESWLELKREGRRDCLVVSPRCEVSYVLF